MNAVRLQEREYYSSRKQQNFRVVESDYVAKPRSNTRVQSQQAQQINRNNSRVQVQPRVRKSVMSQVIIAVLVVFLFLSCVGFITLQSMISSAQREIKLINDDIYNLQYENGVLESRIATAANIEMIRENASKIGMTQPTSDQVMYISASESDIIILSSASQIGAN